MEDKNPGRREWVFSTGEDYLCVIEQTKSSSGAGPWVGHGPGIQPDLDMKCHWPTHAQIN